MQKINQVAGTLLLLLGVLVCIYSLVNFRFGNLASPGPGFFPTIVSIILLIAGIAIYYSSPARSSKIETISYKDIKVISIIMISICFFAVSIKYLGLIISCFLLVLLSSFAGPKQPLKKRLILSIILTTGTVIIFWFLLNINFKLWN